MKMKEADVNNPFVVGKYFLSENPLAAGLLP